MPSSSHPVGLADADVGRFRRSLIAEVAAEHSFSPAELAHRLHAFTNQAGKESVDQRRPASLLIGELACFFRGVLWQTAGEAPPLPRRRRPPSDSSPKTSSSWPTAASKPTTTSTAGCICRILESLTHDLGKVVNTPG